jgi:hypothetical protein
VQAPEGIVDGARHHTVSARLGMAVRAPRIYLHVLAHLLLQRPSDVDVSDGRRLEKVHQIFVDPLLGVTHPDQGVRHVPA